MGIIARMQAENMSSREIRDPNSPFVLVLVNRIRRKSSLVLHAKKVGHKARDCPMRSDRISTGASGSNSGRRGNTLKTMLSNRTFEYFVDAYVGNQSGRCLLDSGASASYMNADFCKRFFPAVRILATDPTDAEHC